MAEENIGGQAQAPHEEEGSNRKKRSAAWEHLERFTDVDGEKKAKCKKCHAVLVADSKRHGTKHLMRHIRSCQGRLDGGRSGKHQGSSRPLSAPCEPPSYSKHDGEEATADLARMIALHGYDSSIVEDSYFTSFVRRLNPDFKVPSRVAIEEICDGIFDEAKRNFDFELSGTGHINLAIDTAKIVEGTVLYVACHFIDEKWNRRELIMNAYMVVPRPFFHCPLMGVPEVYLEDGGDRSMIADQISTHITSYSVFSMSIGKIGDLGNYLKNDLEDLKNDLEDKDYLGEPCYDTTYVDIVLHKVAQRCYVDLKQEFISDVYHDELFCNFTRQKREELLSQLGLDDLWLYDEHWYSCYCSLQILHKYYSEISEFTELLRKLWGEIYRAIKAISDPNRPTSNICLGELFKVREFLQSELAGASGVKAAVYKDINGFDKNVEHVLRGAEFILDSSIQYSFLAWSIPLVLDPRYKLRYIEFSFHRAFGSKAENYVSEVTEAIKEMFTDYSEDDGEATDGDPNRVAAIAVARADPLQQAWNEHCRLHDGMTEVARTELDCYLEDRLVAPTDGFDILNWWKVNSSKYPTVARMARAALAMPTCSKLSSEQISQIRSRVRGYSKEAWFV